VRNNSIDSCHTAGISIGGYDEKRGSTDDTVIVNNTLYKNDTWHSGTGEFQMQFHMRNNIFKNNIVYIGDSGRAMLSRSGRVQPNIPTATLENNLYYFPAGPSAVKWSFDNKDYSSFQDYVQATGNDRHSKFADPKFVDPAASNFHLQRDSPALGNGVNLGPSMVSTQDLDGSPRSRKGKIDIGCYEMR
jgi:hypothetical protein